jgi:type IV fimbrial biogenesis protein FimT
MRNFNRQSGFSILDIMVALAVFTVLAAISTPNLKNWMRVYRLKSAAMDLYSNIQMAKMNAVKENRQWKLRFNSGGFYDVIRCLTVTCENGNINVDYQIPRNVQFSIAYSNEVQFKNPTSTTVFEQNPLILNANGLANFDGFGFVYISNKQNSSYYRIGLLSVAGSVRIQKWNSSSSTWE